jgi:hypothetical protein
MHEEFLIEKANRAIQEDRVLCKSPKTKQKGDALVSLGQQVHAIWHSGDEDFEERSKALFLYFNYI